MENIRKSVHQQYNRNTTRTLTEQTEQQQQQARQSYKQPRAKLTQIVRAGLQPKCALADQNRRHIETGELKKYINLRTPSYKDHNANMGHKSTAKLRAIDSYVTKCLEKYQTSSSSKREPRNKNKENRDPATSDIPIELSVEIKQIFRHI